MTDFDGIWAKASARMDETTDRIIGDRVSYSREGKGFEMIDAYIVISRADLDAPSEFDETVAITKRLKVRCSLIPAPDIADRVRHPLLGPGTYRPTTSLPAEQGRYWIADLQKV